MASDITAGNDYELAFLAVLYETQNDDSELCMIREGTTVKVIDLYPTRFKVKYQKYTGYLNYTSNGISLLREKKRKKGFFSSIVAGVSGSKIPSGGGGGPQSYNNKAANANAFIQGMDESDIMNLEERGLCIEDGVYHTLGVCTLRVGEDLFSNDAVDIPPPNKSTDSPVRQIPPCSGCRIRRGAPGEYELA